MTPVMVTVPGVDVAGLVLVGGLLAEGLLQGPWKVDTLRGVDDLLARPAGSFGDRHQWVYAAISLMRAWQPIDPDAELSIGFLLYEQADVLEELLA